MTSYLPILSRTEGSPGTVAAREKSMVHNTMGVRACAGKMTAA
jgi:hypothetical protein